VPALSRAALAAGADGLLLEVHPHPENALSDGAQSLNIAEFAKLMGGLAEPVRRVQVRVSAPLQHAPQRRESMHANQ
jgi:3-deoxy-7-phosphoheptulonate synthase